MRRLIVLAFALALAACNSGPASVPPSATPWASSLAPSGEPGAQLMLRLSYEGGFVASQSLLTRLPMFSLYADGSLIETGMTPAIYPGPALPSLLVSHLSSDALGQLMTAAAAAGVAETDQTYPSRGTADAPDTVIIARAAQGLITTRLGLAAPDATMSAVESALRARVTVLTDLIGTWRAYLGPLAPVGSPTTYRPNALKIWLASPPAAGDVPTPMVKTWPLDGPLADFGAPSPVAFEPLRCAIVRAHDLDVFWPILIDTNQATLFSDGATTVSLLLRPLLPDESAGC